MLVDRIFQGHLSIFVTFWESSILYEYQQWRKYRFEPAKKNLVEKGPLTNTQKKAWEMMVNPDVDGVC